MPPRRKSTKVGKSPKAIKIQSLLRHEDLPPTVGLVNEVRAELLSEIRSVGNKIASVDQKTDAARHDMSAMEKRLDGKFASIDGKFVSIDNRFASIDQKFEAVHHDMGAMEKRLDGRIDQVLSSVHRTQTLMEEQRGENKIVLDGIKSVMERQDRAESEAKDFRKTLQLLVTTRERTTQ